MRMVWMVWRRLPVLITLLAMAACAGPRLERSGSQQPSVTLTDAGIQFTILPNTWNGYPRDLGRHFTPVEIAIQNDRSDEILVRYEDFLAMDEARTQYRAIAPAEVARALFGGREPDGSRGQVWRRESSRPVLLAWHRAWWPTPYWPHPFWHPLYGPYSPDPFFYEYPSWQVRSAGYDILTMGLREGRLLPGARIGGVLYFQQATRVGSLLTLSWTPASAEGKPLATLSSQFRIVR